MPAPIPASSEGIDLPGANPCRSYAAVPLIAGDHRISAPSPRSLRSRTGSDHEHITLLEILGRQAVTRLELYARIRAQEHEQRARQRSERALAIERCFVAATLTQSLLW